MGEKYLEIYSTNRKIKVLENITDIKIMNFLSQEEKNFKAIVEYVKKAKSTVSNCLYRLEREELISSRSLVKDTRKKFYKNTATLLAKNQKPSPKLFEKSLERFNSVDNPINFMNSLFRSMRYMLCSFGVDAKPMLYVMGQHVGNEIVKKISSSKINLIINELNTVWKKNKLGYLEIDESPFTFVMHNCYECSGMEDAGTTLCSFDEGIFKSIFDKKLKKDSVVREIECNGTGHGHCKFVIGFE